MSGCLEVGSVAVERMDAGMVGVETALKSGVHSWCCCVLGVRVTPWKQSRHGDEHAESAGRLRWQPDLSCADRDQVNFGQVRHADPHRHE